MLPASTILTKVQAIKCQKVYKQCGKSVQQVGKKCGKKCGKSDKKCTKSV